MNWIDETGNSRQSDLTQALESVGAQLIMVRNGWFRPSADFTRAELTAGSSTGVDPQSTREGDTLAIYDFHKAQSPEQRIWLYRLARVWPSLFGKSYLILELIRETTAGDLGVLTPVAAD
jgi:hypothetical protein